MNKAEWGSGVSSNSCGFNHILLCDKSMITPASYKSRFRQKRSRVNQFSFVNTFKAAFFILNREISWSLRTMKVKKLYLLVIVIMAKLSTMPASKRPESKRETASIIFAGDITFDGPLKYFVETEKSCNYEAPFSRIKRAMADADLRVGNLECSLFQDDSNLSQTFINKPIHHFGVARAVKGLKYAGFDIIQLANNHISDYGTEGVRNTVNVLDDAGIDFFGLRNFSRGSKQANVALGRRRKKEILGSKIVRGDAARRMAMQLKLEDMTKPSPMLLRKHVRRSAEGKSARRKTARGKTARRKAVRLSINNNIPDASKQQPIVKVINGIKIGFLAYCQNAEGCDIHECNAGECKDKQNMFDVGPAVYDKHLANEEVKALKKFADIVVVLMHWSRELATVPPQGVRDIAKSLSTFGATIIIGSHPHVIQGHECLRFQSLVVYSLGNILFPKTGVNVGDFLAGRKPSKSQVKKYLEGLDDVFNLSQLGYLFKVTVSRDGIVNAEYLPFEVKNEPKTNCLQPTPLSKKWQKVCVEDDIYCFDFRNIYATAPIMLDEQLYIEGTKSRLCLKGDS